MGIHSLTLIISCQYFYLNDTRPEARKNRKQCAELCEVGHGAILRSRIRRNGKNLGFS